MAESRSSPPVAVRIVRPYADEASFLAAEASAFTRTGVVLVGAPSRPTGVVLRFEIAAKNGAPLMRGEGRVVGYRAPTANEEGALMLRFTRLDVKSKALLDRAVAMRVPSQRPPPPAAAPPPPVAVSAPPVAPIAPTRDAHAHDDAHGEAPEETSDATMKAPPVAPIDLAPEDRTSIDRAPVASPAPARAAPPPSPAPAAPPPSPPKPPSPASPPSAPSPPSPVPAASNRSAPSVAAGNERKRHELEGLPPERRESALDRLRQRKRGS